MMDTIKQENIPVTAEKETVAKAFMKHPIDEMERAFDKMFGRRWLSSWRGDEWPTFDDLLKYEGLRLPKVDMISRENEILIRAEMPGMQKDDIEVSVADNLLTIKGKSKKEEKEEKGDYYRREISSSSYARSIAMPSNIDAKKASANLKDGILEVKIPKTEASKRQSIAVQ